MLLFGRAWKCLVWESGGEFLGGGSEAPIDGI